MSEKLKFNPTPELAPKNVETGKEKINFENGERPNYRYYYHGTFQQFLGEIEESGFKFKEYFPHLTLSPMYGFRFLETEVEKGPEHLASRGKHLKPDKRRQFKPEELTIDDSVLLVIEPTKDYQVHSTNEGKPNFFSTDDQIPNDVDEKIRTRIWTSYQQMTAEEPIGNKSSKDYRYPGLFLNKKFVPATGEWVRIENEKKIDRPGKLPATSIKMIIKRNPEFMGIFQQMRREFNQVGKINLVTYKKKLIDYFNNGQGVIKNEVEDRAELAENMVVGEFEHYIVTSLRRLYLEIEKYKGKKIISGGEQREDDRPPRTKEELSGMITRIMSLKPDNEVFQRYIEIYTAGLKKELNSQ